MSSEKKVRVAVIGGGIGGLCVAIGLLKHKHLEVSIYEAAHKFSEIGAGVAFGPNSQRAMALIDETVHRAFMAQATHNQAESQRSVWFEYRAGMQGKNEELIGTATNETGQATVHRALFLDELVKLVPTEICHFGRRVDQIVDKGKDGVTLHFKNGTTAMADAVIGADGVHSLTREYLLGADHPATKPQFSKGVAYRGLIPMEEAKEAIGAEYAENSMMWVGKDQLVMTYPISFGKVMNVVVIRAGIETWNHNEWVIQACHGELAENFKGWSKTPVGVISLLEKRPLSCWSLWDMMEPAPYYNKGNVCVMGDGAHASTPYQGQGAGQAIEDSLVMEELLGRVRKPEQVAAAFKAFDQVRRPRTQRVIKTSREAGQLMTLRLPGVGDDMEKVKQAVETRMHWMWDIDLEQQNREAIAAMEGFLA